MALGVVALENFTLLTNYTRNESKTDDKARISVSRLGCYSANVLISLNFKCDCKENVYCIRDLTFIIHFLQYISVKIL